MAGNGVVIGKVLRIISIFLSRVDCPTEMPLGYIHRQKIYVYLEITFHHMQTRVENPTLRDDYIEGIIQKMLFDG